MTEEEGPLYTIDDYYDEIKDHIFPDEKTFSDSRSGVLKEILRRQK